MSFRFAAFELLPNAKERYPSAASFGWGVSSMWGAVGQMGRDFGDCEGVPRRVLS
jgi:hypothetical protein